MHLPATPHALADGMGCACARWYVDEKSKQAWANSRAPKPRKRERRPTAPPRGPVQRGTGAETQCHGVRERERFTSYLTTRTDWCGGTPCALSLTRAVAGDRRRDRRFVSEPVGRRTIVPPAAARGRALRGTGPRRQVAKTQRIA